MNAFKRTAAAWLGAMYAGTASAALLSIAQYPLFLTTRVIPNLLVVYDNSESMDGTMAGKLIAGNDPATRGNVARSVITSTINNFASSFNWGLETFATTDWPGPYTTYAYFMGDAATMNFTNDCVSGISVSNGGNRCISNPQLGNGFNFITYARTGDDPDINDVLYINADWGPQLWARGVNGTTNYDMYLAHNGGVATFNAADFSGYQGTWGFTPTDAGFLPSTPPFPRQLFVKRAWGYYSNITGRGAIAEPVKPSTDTTHLARLQSLLGQETINASNPEIKNSAVFTPLAGSFVTAQQYFTGNLAYPSPIVLACQKSFVLLATDGNPTADLSGNMYSLAQQQNIYNAGSGTWTFSQAANDVFTQVSALRSVSVAGRTRDIQTYVVGLGDSVANASSVAALNKFAALGGTNNAYLANNYASLSAAFQQISVDIQSKTAAAAAVSLNAASLNAGSKLFQARFNSGDWAGQLLAYPIQASGSIGPLAWDAGQVLNGQNWDTGRAILSYKPSAPLGARGIPFRWPAVPATPTGLEMDATQSTLLNTALGTLDGWGAQRVQFLRGNTANEKQNCAACVPAFRPRPTSRLGDIVRSAPNYVAAPSFNYPDNLETVAYSTFVAANASRRPMVYVGANDGMLHGFDAGNGIEKFAYIPTGVYPNLSALTGVGVTGNSGPHRYYVDGSPTVGDVFYAGAWHTMLTGSLGAGGQGIYALDVTDPSRFSEANANTVVRWEFTDSNDVDIGYVFAQPLLVKTRTGGWAVIVSNGYNSAEADGRASSSGHAVLFVLDARTGTVLAKLDTQSGTAGNPNGLSGAIGVDTAGDGIVDIVYAGDLAGNMWKFDLSAVSPASWQVALSGSPLFATGGQPITVRPDVTRFVNGGFLVAFGTGQYIDTNDNATTATQSFYGIRDTGVSVSKSNLVRQRVGSNATGTDGNVYRTSSHAVGAATLDAALPGDNQLSPAAYAAKGGWYFDLPDSGERAVSEPNIRSGRVIFNSIIPSADPCSFGGSGWVMEVDVMTGNRYDTPTFDTNGDLIISSADLVNVGGSLENTSGRRIDSIPAAAGFLRVPQPAGMPGYENKYVNTSSGDVKIVGETAGTGGQGRVSWRQLQ